MSAATASAGASTITTRPSNKSKRARSNSSNSGGGGVSFASSIRNRLRLRNLLSIFDRAEAGDSKGVRDSLTHPQTPSPPAVVAHAIDEVGENESYCTLCCSVCDQFFTLQCSHRFCVECLREYLRIQVGLEGKSTINCPSYDCTASLQQPDVLNLIGIISPALYEKFEDFLLRKTLANEADLRFCPSPNCTFAVIAHGCAACPLLVCRRENCNTFFCYHCRDFWHAGKTCEDAKRSKAASTDSGSGGMLAALTIDLQEIKLCPKCHHGIEKAKDGSCNHMICPLCNCNFCWLCMKEITDLHYLSPSGCTFWGKKVWSSKKKFLWQLAMISLAPIGVVLLAGVAVPAIVIGTPIAIALRTRERTKRESKRLRTFTVSGAFLLSLIVSPMIAALVVAIGVPVFLIFIYGVVPISLCRSRGCFGGSPSSDEVQPDVRQVIEAEFSMDAPPVQPDEWSGPMMKDIVEVDGNAVVVEESMNEEDSYEDPHRITDEEDPRVAIA